MSRTSVRLTVAAVAVAALSATAMSDSALAATTTTAPTGSLVIQEDSTFLKQAAANGIIAVALPNATAGYDAATGLSASFPVTGGSANLSGYYGNIQLGGGLLLVNLHTGKAAVFNNLAFSADNWAVTGVPLGESAPVSLLDPVGNTTVTKNAGVQLLTADDLEIDAAGAQYADTKLGTAFFTAGQHTGTATLTFTAGS
ncbi:hypothetical protein C7C46_21080 [Streptomyces tateyamensis]|uniref:Htaa domain-containing protein n=1 Tax=Streptomyces tateyamensis TaxID=565073 RepID=A0A2V4MZ85_9ACTN|nr:hypothetical protein [Streptomyces tateyamensis]PYC76888.1 hypothetical protein C7C46_21080 [Streptomyces tateyamensis]